MNVRAVDHVAGEPDPDGVQRCARCREPLFSLEGTPGFPPRGWVEEGTIIRQTVRTIEGAPVPPEACEPPF